ncbi:uncharacterized protein LOC109122301 [Vitis vinifera]|uniref:uncharacterized protein LOC109122301 n=1 Tax=Vitis vinifera TaxID=29760 RepID=UPI0008FFB3DD|nr:uncharacterized protein LOC109122301 [Vitis vinifera]|eukprot:XP_019074375.1 PREDICTED: uncharacterized protein LOC109122301 [Vitis vinifera]
MWLKVDGFIDLLRGWWQGIEVRGRASFRLAYKMKVLKHNIKVWNREVFGRLEVNKNSALQQLEYWDGVESERTLTLAEAEQKKQAKDAFHHWVLLEEVHWRQKSRELWLKEGDRNTGYFHRMANAHRRNNSMDRIMINGELLTEDQEVRDGIVNEFQKLLSEEQGWRADIEGLQFKQLSSREADGLEVPFSVEEIHYALMEMGGDKALGPDGFSVAFWQECCRLRGRGGEELAVSHLLFADDTLIFCEARREQLANLSWILAWFEAASGLRINLAKSVLIPVGEVDELEELAAELGCRLGALPTVYLGLPFGAHHKTSSSWDGVEERMRRRLAQWKRQYISKGGRITLIKSTLASIPIYLLSLIRIPKAVAKRIERIQRDFLWGGGCLEGKAHLINWKVVCSPKEEGGLGIRKIDLLNKALLGKWVWRYAYEKDNLWKTVIGVKYGQEGCGWKTKEVCGPFGVGLWKDIMKEVDWCWENIDFKVGKGNRVLFWTDKWCGNEALAQSYPQLFTLAGHKNAKICEVWDSSMGQGGWNLRLARDLNDWEMEQIGDMLNLLKDFRTSLEEDSVRWKWEGNGVYGAKGAYKILSGSSAEVFPYRRIWMDKALASTSDNLFINRDADLSICI